MKGRLRLVFTIGILLFVFLYSRLFFLQVIMGGYYEGLSSGNRLKKIIIPATRGAILDRAGKVIAGNKSKSDKIFRFYPDGEMVSSLTGYVSDAKGMTGLEKQYDTRLSGVAGERLIELDARGQEIKTLGQRQAKSGEELQLNIDLDLQKQVYAILNERVKMGIASGSVVIARVGGEVLSLMSLPSYDPNLFTGSGERGTAGGTYPSVEKVLKDGVGQPLFNRAIAGGFPPGSVYKLVPAIAGLATGTITRDTTIEDTGEIKVGEAKFGNWYFIQYGRTEGPVNIEKALARSNDIYFYRLGEKLGVDVMVAWSRNLGLGSKTQIDLPGETEGLVPDPLWREREIGERWFLGNTYNMSIGQGDLQLSPLQVNRMTAAVVSGKKCDPEVAVGKTNCVDLKIDEGARAVILAGMKDVCMSGGTAFPFFSLEGRVYCKTGSAQHGGKETKPHAWISVVIPTKKPEKISFEDVNNWLVMTVMLEGAGEGSYEAGPVARKITDYILDSYFQEESK